MKLGIKPGIENSIVLTVSMFQGMADSELPDGCAPALASILAGAQYFSFFDAKSGTWKVYADVKGSEIYDTGLGAPAGELVHKNTESKGYGSSMKKAVALTYLKAVAKAHKNAKSVKQSAFAQVLKHKSQMKAPIMDAMLEGDAPGDIEPEPNMVKLQVDFGDGPDQDIEPPPVKKKIGGLVKSGISKEVSVGIEKIATGNPVLLRNATELYQPVKGTSQGSRYHVVGITRSGLKIAARFKPAADHSLSIRVESEHGSIKKYSELMGQIGMALMGDDSPTHASMHVVVNDTWLASRTIGSILGHIARSEVFETVVPNFEEVMGYGV